MMKRIATINLIVFWWRSIDRNSSQVRRNSHEYTISCGDFIIKRDFAKIGDGSNIACSRASQSISLFNSCINFF